MPGRDGLDSRFYARKEVKKMAVPILCGLFKRIAETKDMTMAMKEAVITVLYKGGGKDRGKCKSYRPVSVTPMEYRIMMKAVQLKLQGAVEAVLGGTQIAHMRDGRYAHDNTVLLAEAARKLEAAGQSGVALMLDNSAAFDRVRHDFMHEILEAMGFPAGFRDFMCTVYSDLKYRVKVNGIIGEQAGAKNGVRQGCPASALAFLLVQETLLISIRRAPGLTGVKLSCDDAQGVAKERCYADDTIVYLAGLGQVSTLMEVVKRFETASGQELNPAKSVGVIFGEEKQKAKPTSGGVKWVRFGEEPLTEKALGIVVGTEEQVSEQWKVLMGGVREECRERMRLLRRELGATARVNVVRGAYASKALYQAKVQVPKDADAQMEETQGVFDRAVFGEPGDAFYFISRNTAYQHPRDGGLGQVHLKSKVRAEWAGLALSLAGREDTWKSVWLEEMKAIYGELADPGIVHTTCGFELFKGNTQASEVQRRALDAVASMPAPRGRVRRQRLGDTGWLSIGEELGVEEGQWTVEEVRGQRIFFNVWFEGRTRLSGRSTRDVEEEAVAWAAEGVMRVGDLTDARGRMMSAEGFRAQFPTLRVSTYREALGDMPEAWQQRLAVGDEAGETSEVEQGKATGEKKAGKKEQPERPERVWRMAVVGWPETIPGARPPPEKDVQTLGVGGVYDRLVAAMWEVPTTFRVEGDGTRIWRGEGLKIGRKGQDMRRVYESTVHAAVPRHMSDLAYKVATCTDYVGARFHKEGSSRRCCPRCGVEDSAAHKFWKCEEVVKLWMLIGRAWTRMCGERLKWEAEWIAAWGARWRAREVATEEGKAMVLQAAVRSRQARGRGEDGAEDRMQKARVKAEKLLAGRGKGWTEVFQVIHKAALHAIHKEWQRKAPRKATQMYEEMKRTVAKMVGDRKDTASEASFDNAWVRTGLVKGGGKGRVMTGAMWEKSMAPVQIGREKKEEEEVPSGVLEIYTDGSGGKTGKGSAGWGFVVMDGGEERAVGWGAVSLDKGDKRWDGAEVGTNNTAEITAVIRALAWAEGHAALTQVCIRYDSEYACRMTLGEWRPKVNLKLIATAKARLESVRRRGVKVWWKHVKGHSGDKGNDRADELADLGVEEAEMDQAVAEAEGNSRVPGTMEAGGGEAEGEPRRPIAHEGRGVRWVTYQPSETQRVHRSRTAFGALNLPVPSQPISGAEIRRAAAGCLREIGREEIREVQRLSGNEEAARSAARVAREARDIVRGAARTMNAAAPQREEIRRRSRKGVPVHELDCDIDIHALTAYVEEHGEGKTGNGKQTCAQAAAALMKQAKRVSSGVARVRLQYYYPETGRSLCEAGHITGCREMVRGVDPFKWPKGLRNAAIGAIGAEYDDASCYPTAWRAMRGTGGAATETYIEHKEEILRVFGARLWPEAEVAEQRERMKGAMNALDNDGGLSAWAKRHPSTTVNSLAGMKEGLSARGVVFAPSQYKKEQEIGTQQAMVESKRALQYLAMLKHGGGDTPAGERKRRTTLKSYMLQEAEAASREAKIKWCEQAGVRVVSLQHDGIVAIVGAGEESDSAAKGMAREATAACGYGVKVIPKRAPITVN